MEEKTKFEPASHEIECAICWEILSESEAANLCLSNLMKVCDHRFHEACAQQISQPWKCPLCRARFYRISLSPRLGAMWRYRSDAYRQSHASNPRLEAEPTPSALVIRTQYSPSMTIYTYNQPVRIEAQMAGNTNSFFEERAPANFIHPSATQFSVEELQSSFPSGVDPTRKEEYLSDVIFRELFGMEKESFRSLPRWKQVIIKKRVKLF